MSGAFIRSPKFPPEPRRIGCLPCHISFPVPAGLWLVVVILTVIWIIRYVPRRKNTAYNLDPQGKPGAFEPLLQKYLRLGEFIVPTAFCLLPTLPRFERIELVCNSAVLLRISGRYEDPSASGTNGRGHLVKGQS